MSFDSEGVLISQNFAYLPCPIECFSNEDMEIDEIIENTTKGTSLLGKWVDLLNAHSRKRVAQQDIYREIESMLNNDLFVVHRDLQLIV